MCSPRSPSPSFPPFRLCCVTPEPSITLFSHLFLTYYFITSCNFLSLCLHSSFLSLLIRCKQPFNIGYFTEHGLNKTISMNFKSIYKLYAPIKPYFYILSVDILCSVFYTILKKDFFHCLTCRDFLSAVKV